MEARGLECPGRVSDTPGPKAFSSSVYFEAAAFALASLQSAFDIEVQP
jgi:hypothetical protein